MKLILATHNIHKRNELVAQLTDAVEVENLPDNFPDIEETALTLVGNARVKARAVYDFFHLDTLADDTGLEVVALNGAPGVFTARYAGEKATYKDNCLKLLKEMEGESDRSAKFVTALCYIDKEGREEIFLGVVEGKISDTERGLNGFGYDPVFIPNEGGSFTFAEMDAAEKNTISHRGRAIRRFLDHLLSREQP